MCYPGVGRLISSCHSFVTPATDSMPTKIACGANVTGVAVAADELSLGLAVTRSTLEDVHLTALNVHNGWSWSKEGIDRCVPLSHKPCYELPY